MAVLGLMPSCNLVLGLDKFQDCPGCGGGSSGMPCSTPADCPGGGECATAACSGGVCGLTAVEDGKACSGADGGAGFTCKGGACECPPENMCGGGCVDTSSDVANCGGCGKACPSGIACVDGACACPNMEVVCGSACVDTSTDAMNCGMCGHACTVTGAMCVESMCVCPGGGTECSGACVDTSTDAMNCGTCGHLCTDMGAVCVGGMCMCPAGQTDCGGACVDMSADAKNCGACGHDCLGGACQAGACQPVVLASGQSYPTEIAVSSSVVFWINSGPNGAIMQVPSSGGTVSVAAASQTTPTNLAVDSASVYWTIDIGIRKVPISGGLPTAVTNWGSAYHPRGLALDASSIYWLSDAGEVRKLPLSGGANPAPFKSGLVNPVGLSIDAANLYWEDNTALQAMPKGGGAVTTLDPAALSGFAVGGSYVYYFVSGSPKDQLKKTPIAGGASTILGGYDTSRVSAVDSAYVYVTAAGDLYRVAINGGSGVLLAKNAKPSGLAVDGTAIYWTSGTVVGTVMRLAK